MRYYFTVFASILILGTLAACNFNVKEIQNVEIDYFDNLQANQELAEALLYYDPRYVAEHVEGYDAESASGIKIAYFKRASDGQPSLRITYNRSNSFVADRIDLLKKGFAEFYQALAKEHVSHQAEFDALVPIGYDWIKTLFESDTDALYEQLGERMKSVVPQDQFQAWHSRALDELLVFEDAEYQRAQHYEPMDGFPESNAMYYRLQTSSGKSPTVKVNFTQVETGWQVTAFGMFMD